MFGFYFLVKPASVLLSLLLIFFPIKISIFCQNESMTSDHWQKSSLKDFQIPYETW